LVASGLTFAVASLLFCGADHTPGPGRQIGFDSDRGEQGCGQYACVVASPLSEEEAKASLEHLAALPRRDVQRPAAEATSSVRAQAFAVSARV
jgi:hypothetical protein